MEFHNDLRLTAQKLIKKDKWWETLSRFINVLRINLFIIDCDGFILLPPEEGRFGGGLLTKPANNLGLFDNGIVSLDQFRQQGAYLECATHYGLSCSAIPIKLSDNTILAYLVVGPVIHGRKPDMEGIRDEAKARGQEVEGLAAELNEVRVVSPLMLNSILDLLNEIIRDSIQLSTKEEELKEYKVRTAKKDVSKELSDVAEQIYSTVRLDELLVILLDVALKITETERGSIMVLDESNQELELKISRGLDKKIPSSSKQRLGEGLSGLAVKQNKTFLITENRSDDEIKPLLKHPELKESVILPLQAKDKVFGVLNLSTKSSSSKISENLDNLQYLTQLLSSAI